ncbi:bifunctional diguanylate cyclase/phosphodiesterase [Halomonas sp. YLGW01]|uniref:putative bifunctional diguanylate cyclase/phosphodiesterase n=1 Tax=Halomonas sp. YLGW01 TaxID=2773308 RepID=UPI00178212C9|nr:bifunctional diguanylate cyclase/phosphodiesterase [Halomonas sp. YLGW01]
MTPKTSLSGAFLKRLVPVALLVTLVCSLLSAWQQQQRFEAELGHKKTQLLELGATMLASPLWNFDSVRIGDMLDTLLADADVVGVRLHDSSGDLLQARYDGHQATASETRKTPIIFRNAFVERPIGQLSLSFSDQRLTQQILTSALTALLATGLLAMLVTGWSLYFLRRRVVAPLSAIHRRLAAVGRGETLPPQPVSAPGEVGQALQAFNTLALQLKSAQQEIQQQARRDTLTGLCNRYGMNDELLCWIDRHPDRPLGLLHLDINHLRWTNLGYGRETGNRVLIELARRLQGIGAQHLVIPPVRLGSDEFALAVADACPTRLQALVREVQDRLRAPFVVDDQELYLSMTIGGALYPEHAETLQELLKRAEQALYRSKESARGDYRLYQPAVASQQVEQMAAIERDLHQALSHEGLELALQPIMGRGGRHIIGVEALVRLHHPERGMLSPADFIPAAEESGVIVAIDEWVIEQGLAWLAKVSAAGQEQLTISFNVSVQEIHTGRLPCHLEEALHRHGLAPERIIIEVTEHLMLEPSETVLEVFAALHRLGCRLAIDDFGTGFSSLGYLQRHAFDIIKIDRSFMVDATTDQQQGKLVNAMVEMGHALGLQVTIEGVETDDQASYCRQLGAEHQQGFHYARPMPAQTLLERLSSSETLVASPAVRC